MTELTRNLRGLVLSATELRSMTDWSEALIEDYLTILENLIDVAEGVEDSMPKVPGADEDNIPVFDDEGQIKDSGVGIDEVSLKVIGGDEDNILVLDSDGDMKDGGESIDNLRARSYFYGRTY